MRVLPNHTFETQGICLPDYFENDLMLYTADVKLGNFVPQLIWCAENRFVEYH